MTSHLTTDVEHAIDSDAAPHPLWWAALGYAALVGTGWLSVAINRWLRWRFYTASAEGVAASGNLEQADRINQFAGSFLVDMGYGLVVAAVCAFVIIALHRRSWNAWDYATVAAGGAAVLSAIFICASDRVMFFIPFTMGPLVGLLYTQGVKATCGVQATATASTALDEASATQATQQNLERELAHERQRVAQLGQNLDVFEVERSMSTDVFVDRYVNGLEEETPDNAEWFSIARTVRRSQERIAELQAQLAAKR